MKQCLFCYKEISGDVPYHAACSKKFFGTDAPPVLKFDEALLDALAKQTVNKRIAVTGVQPKLSVTLEKQKGSNRLTVVGLWGEYILKPQHKRYAQLPETEDLTMHLAALFKLPVCQHTLLEASDGSRVYLAKRFDRKDGKKIHVEDFCQLAELLTENKYKSSYEKAGRIVATYCSKGLDLLTYFELVLFSYLCGNNDMHLKNFSLLHIPNGAVLSPAYDLLNVSLVNPADKEEMALTLNGKKRKLRLADFVTLAESLGIAKKVYTHSFKRFASRNKDVEALIASSFLRPEMKKGYQEIWAKRQQILFQNG